MEGRLISAENRVKTLLFLLRKNQATSEVTMEFEKKVLAFRPTLEAELTK